jgi:hypothetical protein
MQQRCRKESQALALLVAITLLIVPARLCLAQQGRAEVAFGARAGFSDSRPREDFHQYDIFMTYELPWRWSVSSGWELRTRLKATAALLRAAGERGLIFSAGPGFVVANDTRRISLIGGYSVGLLTEHEYGRHDLGGPLQFTGHLGVAYRLHRSVEVGYRLQHMSNAGIYDPNPGLDMHMFFVSGAF